MYRRKVEEISDVVSAFLRQNGLETPLLQKRLIDKWGELYPAAMKYTGEKYIRNQVLFVKILSPALRQNLSMMRTDITQKLNDAVGAKIIIDVRFV
ncbi:MAG: DUF721 domain-containing protein [Prevotella sp.]|nr:DUF721 domain-containing protein [Prevotella sp.]